MSNTVVLTGIKPTGMPHLGNYLGAIRPALQMAEVPNTEARFFIADYHSLNSVRDAATLRSYIYEVAAVWLAAGLDPSKVLIYKQSDVPETFELTTILMAFTAKDIEQLRERLGISRWHVFGGSYGSTIALYYAQEFPQHCKSLVLRGIWLLREEEIDWWIYRIRMIQPEL